MAFTGISSARLYLKPTRNPTEEVGILYNMNANNIQNISVGEN